jgi:subtilisin family serine protease
MNRYHAGFGKMADRARMTIAATFLIGILNTGFPLQAQSDQEEGATSNAIHGVQAFSVKPATPQGTWTPTPNVNPNGANDYFCVYNVEFRTAEQRQHFEQNPAPGVTVFSSIDRFADIFVTGQPIYNMDEKGRRVLVDVRCDEAAGRLVRSSTGYVWSEFSAPGRVPPPPSPVPGQRTRGGASPEKIVQGGMKGLTGKNVIVAVIDSGIDFRNHDFIATDSSGRPISRLLYFWDSIANNDTASRFSGLDSPKPGRGAPISYPNGAPVGVVYTREQLTAVLRSNEAGISATDSEGHGTAATGIATGATRGVAPEADIIGVRIGSDGEGLQNAWILNAALEWIEKMASRMKEPVVVSCSFGGQMGAHDGTKIEEREIDARFKDEVRGRAIVIAAGNEQRRGFHSAKSFAGQTKPAVFTLATAREGADLTIFVRSRNQSGVDENDLQLKAREGENAIRPPGYINRINGNYVIELHIAGRGQLALWNQSGTPMEADAYLNNGKFDLLDQTPYKVVGTPGTAKQAITVGSYDWNDQFSSHGETLTLVGTCSDPIEIGQLSCYSSPGFVLENLVKPEIVGPGEWYSAPYAKAVSPEVARTWYTDTSGNYALFNGTSAATPYVAGMVALMLQKKPTLTVGEIKGILEKNATADFRTGGVPNPKWGYGKLDYAAAQRILDAVH